MDIGPIYQNLRQLDVLAHRKYTVLELYVDIRLETVRIYVVRIDNVRLSYLVFNAPPDYRKTNNPIIVFFF